MVKKKSTSVSKRVPELRGAVACDSISTDPNSRKLTLYGVFNNLHPEKVPSTVTFCVYVGLIGGAKQQELSINILDSGNKPLMPSPLELILHDPSHGVDINIRVVGEVKRKGPHRIVLYSGRKKIGETHLFSVLPKKRTNDG